MAEPVTVRPFKEISLVKERAEPLETGMVDDAPRERAVKGEVPFPRRRPVRVVAPVPPYATPIEVVAETTPALACRGPLREPRVKELLNVIPPVNVLLVYVLGIVVEL